MELDVEVAKLRLLKSEFQSQRYRLEDSLLKTFPQQITAAKSRIEGIEKDVAAYAAEKEKTVDIQTTVAGGVSASSKFPGMTINGVTHVEKEPAAKALLDACKGVTDKADKPVGEYMGFQLSIRFDSFTKQFQLLLRGAMTYQTDLGTDAFGNITRINNALDKLTERLDGAKEQLANYEKQVGAAKLELEKPFAQEDELREKEAQLALLNADLNIDGDGGMDIENEADERGDDELETEQEQPDEDESEQRGNPFSYTGNPQTITYGERKDNSGESRTGTYGKSKPSIIDGLRNFDGSKQPSVPVKTKVPERD